MRRQSGIPLLRGVVVTTRRARLGQGLLACLWATSAVVVAFGLYLYLSYHQTTTNQHRSQAQNALWASHQWVGENHTSSEYVQLASRLKENGITDVFFHVGPLNPAGGIDQHRYPNAASLLENLKALYPEVRAQAWIGQVEVAGGGPLDLSDDEVRGRIVATAIGFLDMGFDGVHYNIEPVASGNRDFIELLRSTREITQARNKVLSVAADELEPFPQAERLVRIFASQAGFWNRRYYLDVAASVDQIAVMMYDTALPTSWLYGSLVKWETKNLLELVGEQVTLFMGVPSYEDRRWSFNPDAENVQSALRGIRKGLEHCDDRAIVNFGVAIYAEWTTEEGEWELYRQEWLGEE